MIVLYVLLAILGLVWFGVAVWLFCGGTPDMSLGGKLRVSLLWPIWLFALWRYWR